MKKKLTNQDKIVVALDSVDAATLALRKYGNKYDEYIDAAALRGDDARAKKLIRQKMGVSALAEQLSTLKANIELGAYTSQAMASLGTLPQALAGCKGLLAESPNFAKLGDSIKRIFKDMQKPVEEISKLNDTLEDVLAPQASGDLLTSRLDGANPIEETDQFKAEYAAMIERIKPKLGTETVAKPVSTLATNPATGDIDFAGIIDEENKR